MQLIGHYSSPFVRRVAITAQYLGVPLEQRKLSVFSDYEEFRRVQALVKVPTLVCDDGSLFVDSTLIIDYLQSLAVNATDLMPDDAGARLAALQAIGIGIVANEKCAQIVYETSQRPKDKQHEPWRHRLQEQLVSALDALESIVANVNPWMFGEKISQADITIAVTWLFVTNIESARIDAAAYPALCNFSEAAEALPEFQACKP